MTVSWSDVLAQAVLPHIPTDGTWIESRDLAERAGITKSQLARGIRRIKEIGPPLPLVRKGSRYQFTLDPETVDNYKSPELAKAHTIISLLLSGTLEPFFRGTSHPFADQVIRNVERVLEDIKANGIWRMDQLPGRGENGHQETVLGSEN